MKKVLYVFVIFIFFLANSYAFANEKDGKVEFYIPTKEELGGVIEIPNIDGTWDRYEDINTYEDLYSVLEDLSGNYRDLLEEYQILKGNYEDEMVIKDRKIEDLELEIKDLQPEAKSSNTTKSNIFQIVINIIIIAIFAFIYFYKK